jgi:hypothetical protein
MKIEDFDSVQDLSTPLEIETALGKRHDSGLNSFWLSHGAERFPAINIMINGDLAYVHYFPEERHPGYASVGGPPNLTREGITNFFPHPSDEPFDIRNDAVVPFSKALKVAQEFAASKGMPKCIAWRSLTL